MNWQDFNALCARRMHVYAVVDVLEKPFGMVGCFQGEVFIVNNGSIENYQLTELTATRLDALRAGLRAVVIERETETGGRRE